MFQVFQLTALVIRGSPVQGEAFTVCVDRVIIKMEEVRGVLLCVQDFVRSPHFTQKNFFSKTGFPMLSESVAIADSIMSSPVHAPWSAVESASASQVITVLCVCVGIGWCHVVAPPKTQVSAGLMVAPLEVRQRQGQGWGYQTSLRRGALSTCRLLRLILVLLGQAKFVLPPVSGRERSPVVQWSCHGNLKSQVLQLVLQGGP